MRICIVGAGNIGLALASELSLDLSNEVVLYTKTLLDTSQLIFKNLETKKEYRNLKIEVENDLKTAVSNKDYIFCTYPAFLRKKFIDESERYINYNCNLGFVPGYGGAEYMCSNLIKKGVVVFGLQRVPFVARQENKRVSSMISKKESLFLAALPKRYTANICKDIERLLKIQTNPLREYLAITLAPSNPLLHLCGLYNVFSNYENGDHYKDQLMFYEEWNDETSKLLFEYDQELQLICSKMTPLVLDEIISLKKYYESNTPEKMTKKLKSITAFNIVKVPLLESYGKYYPDFDSRMFIEDFPYGIAIIKYFAIIMNVKTPTINRILQFYKDKTGISYFKEDDTPDKDFQNTGIPANFGIKSKDEIIEFYRQ